ncbi:hypothetical protein SDRG_10092 [Saprolegnia diclina VS20]|uniref:Uncharacterized protein n=1 Tax=Saprolegnia diclina (strain VS20) TaxID=1156394 RepID=T0QFH3_SAPDV|nr:hypothetical protein SDRG_10092 [Saprolegnia diclina VS20]EQC32345.1 hypothetical protein SDRG_10092 [Saprolegnia diclina VS20]|eukprot:XP_008614286.1 hypothetical protein SDRG_10092 [Saprolegnia diclina VS20]
MMLMNCMMLPATESTMVMGGLADDACSLGGTTPLDFAYDGAPSTHAELVAAASTIDACCSPAAVRRGGEGTRKNLCICVDDVAARLGAIDNNANDDDDVTSEASDSATADDVEYDDDEDAMCKRKRIGTFDASDDTSGYVSLASCEEAFHVSKRPKLESIDYSCSYPETTAHVQLSAVHNDQMRFFFTPFGAGQSAGASQPLAVQFPFVASGTFEMAGSSRVIATKTRSTPATPRLVDMDA